MRNIQTLQLSDLIPSSIASDPQVVSAIAAIDAELQAVSAQIEVVTLIARIDELDGPTLDQLAWHFNVPFYSDDFSVVQKRGAVKRAVYWRRISGTKAAVVEALKSIQYNTEVTEWFEENGVPYTFAVDIDTEDADVSSNFLADVLSLINATKNTRSHLSRLRVVMNPPVNGIAGAGQQIGLYCATGGPLQVIGGLTYPPTKLEADAYAEPFAEGDLTQPLPVYFATGHGSGDMNVWKVDGSSFTSIGPPDVEPNNSSSNLIYSVDFAPNADYMVAACNQSPRIYLYKRNGDTFNKLPDPAVLPAGVAGGGAKFSPDGSFLAVSHNGGGMSIYERSGDTFTRLTNPADVMFSNGTSVAWNASGEFVAIAGYQLQPYIYRRTGSTFTKIGFPSTALPTYPNDMAFSQQSDLLVCVHQSAPFVSVSSITGVVHTRHADPDILPTSTANAVAINPEGTMAVIGVESPPYLALYEISGTTLTKISNPADLPNSPVYAADFNPEGTVLTVGMTTAPYMMTYAVSGTTLTQISNPASVPAQAVRAVVFS